jgi:lipopolysaccharide export system ATP-binding protein
MESTPTQTSSVLKVEGLIKIYGTRRVVDGVSFHVNQGEIVGLLGPNGAGKTTSFRMACGLINTNGGIVYLGNQDVTGWPMYKRSRDGGMGYLPQDKSVFQRLSVENNLYGVMEMIGMKRAERKSRCEELLEKFRLTHLRHNYGGGLSGGERRRLEIARSLVSKPKIILLDEPFAAIDPVTVSSIQEIIRQLASEGIAILITDHSVQDTLEITQRSYVIQAGKVLCHGTPSEVLTNPEARKVYFGDKISGKDPAFGQGHADKTSHSTHAHSDHSEHTLQHRAKQHAPQSAATASNPEWEVSAVVNPPPEKREPIQPFALQIGLKRPLKTEEEKTAEPVRETVQATVQSKNSADSKRLQRVSSTITMPEVHPVSQPKPEQATPISSGAQEERDGSLSTIIRSLGKMVGKR